jgi:hypothetical protein
MGSVWGARDWRARDALWRVRDREKEKDGHFPNEYNPVTQLRSADILQQPACRRREEMSIGDSTCSPGETKQG